MQSEHAADGRLLMRAFLEPMWLGTYRTFKFATWVGMPQDPPDVVAREVESGESIEVFASWNGATEVVSLRRLLFQRMYCNSAHTTSLTRTNGIYTRQPKTTRIASSSLVFPKSASRADWHTMGIHNTSSSKPSRATTAYYLPLKLSRSRHTKNLRKT